ncbi:unnamed protein product [Durusdinium trenchii]|uniref:Uncharacterized protein n=1 Tax=Durusdinium trenchii TaxID=1381693 RepID=A0ABP0N7T1_9DINO
MLDLESGDSGAKLKPKGSTKEPTSGPTPGGNVIKIETREGSMNSDTITYFFSGSEEMPLITVEETKLDGPCTHSTGLTVTIQEPGALDRTRLRGTEDRATRHGGVELSSASLPGGEEGASRLR